MSITHRLARFAVAAAFTGAAATGLRAETLKVVVTIAPIHSLVAAVMEGQGQPRLLVKGASSEHTYSMRPSDARALNDADLVIRVSDRLETFLNKPIASLSKKATLVTLADMPGLTLLPPREGGTFEAHVHEESKSHAHGDAKTRHGADEPAGAHEDEHEEGEYDPHLWLDTANAALIADHVADILGKARPDEAAAYKANAAKLKERLNALDAEIKAQAAGLEQARFIVFHDAYQYFEARYGLKAAGSITVSPERQPGAARLKAIRAKIAGAGTGAAACIFSEPQFEPKLVARLIEGTDARSGTLDGLGANMAEGPDLYFTIMRNLMASLKTCLASR